MKSYLGLIPAFAKAHRRQSRMTVLCIVFAVFLVTGVFSMAEMGIRMESSRLVEKHGPDAVLSLLGSESAQSYLAIAGVLFVLILIAGVLMISGSINSSVAQRTRFFGLLRCIGMSRGQVARFVRLEALSWCGTAIPIGVALGVVCSWALCAVLRFLVGEEFTDIPLFGVSLIGILSGVLMGVAAVLAAAGAPARRAARVSPVTAVSGNSGSEAGAGRVSVSRAFKIETALGIDHALGSRKNLLLMTGSFALSIVLFLSFSALVELVNCMLPQSSSAPDIGIYSADGDNSLSRALPERLEGMAGVENAYGRRSLLGAPAEISKGGFSARTVDLISYDAFELDCLKKDGALKRGGDPSRVYGDGGCVLLIADGDAPLAAGDSLRVCGEELTVAGRLRYNPFTADGGSDGVVTLICSGETFMRLTGVSDYSLVLIRAASDMSDEDAEALRLAVGGDCVFQDMRAGQTRNTYLAFVACLYGFMAVIALITVLGVMSNISMSVSSRIKQYGAMRAVGMELRQVTGMLAAEAFTYALSGCAAGCVLGLLSSRLIYSALITPHYAYAVWSVPVLPLAVILLFILAAVWAAVRGPAERIRRMSVTETVNEL